MPAQRTSGTPPGEALTSTASAGRSSTCVDKRLLQELETVLQLVVGDRQRGQQANDVAVGAAAQQEQTALEARARDRRGESRRLLDELERSHGAEAPVLADLGNAGGELVEPALERGTERLGPGTKLVFHHA